MRVNNAGVSLPVRDCAAGADINMRGRMATVWAALNFASDNRREMIPTRSRCSAAAASASRRCRSVTSTASSTSYTGRVPGGIRHPHG